LPATLQERFLRIKKKVREAIESRHTFMIYGKSRVIRECMLSRGWCEKFYRKPTSNGDRMIGTSLEASPVTLLAGIGDLKDPQSERLLISRMLADNTVDFLWNSGSEWAGWPSRENGTTLFNRYCRAAFTSKVGLCSSVRQMYWYYEADVANTLFPRCYNVCQSDQMHAFVEDFRFTACLSLLKWLVETIDNDGENAARSTTGTIPLKALDFAIRRCTDYMGARCHEDIDRELERVWSHQWDQFIRWYYKIVHGESVFVLNDVPIDKYFLASRHVLKKIRKFRQQLDMDGTMNVWILKPGNKSRGRGIVLVNKLEDVVARINPANKTDTRYVVQKYIERPMLIHSTKFDIRQWFIVTCAQPLTLWMYRESYLRFCSQNYRLSDFHESIHLCNNAVQCKYKNSPDRDPALPVDNMWDATTFKQYLKEQGHGEAWDDLIYPGMRQGLVGSLLASQEAMDRRKNSFELYGADFMLMDDFSVWLIEINSHPDMSYSSSVTTRLCKRVMEDTIKVVIDLREDKNADTGLFELAYRQKMPSCQPYPAAALSLQGTRITGGEKKPDFLSSSGSGTRLDIAAKSANVCPTKTPSKNIAHGYVGPVIVDLIEELELRLDREFLARCNLDSSARSRPNFSIASAPVTGSSSKISLALVKPTEEPGKKEDENEAKTTTTASENRPRRASTRRSKPPKTADPLVESHGPNLVSKIVQLQRESAHVAASSVNSRKSPGKSGTGKALGSKEKKNFRVIDSAMRDAATRYKKFGARMSLENSRGIPPPISTATSSSPARAILASTANSESLKTSRRTKSTHRKRSKVPTDVDNMYAVGLGLSK
ncbi:tubulin glycylase 3A-like, partial [Venturia canescens]|uniref:tubulin glycylase 3A-like n=1 Tax=Venturia canescens TaxID=32260 RepID=UPI001C9C7FDC